MRLKCYTVKTDFFTIKSHGLALQNYSYKELQTTSNPTLRFPNNITQSVKCQRQDQNPSLLGYFSLQFSDENSIRCGLERPSSILHCCLDMRLTTQQWRKILNFSFIPKTTHNISLKLCPTNCQNSPTFHISISYTIEKTKLNKIPSHGALYLL